ncbi:hypothetical protein HA466_0212140 [Hirschfeldia incana]|nr:hypothetical protein HA466_0212140 [Hirschfeldia incana]
MSLSPPLRCRRGSLHRRETSSDQFEPPPLTTQQLKLTFYPRRPPSLMDLNPRPPPEPPDPPDPPDRATPSKSKTFIFFTSSAAPTFVTQLDAVVPPPRVRERTRSAQLERILTGSVHHFTPTTTPTSASPPRLAVVPPPSCLAAVTPTSPLTAHPSHLDIAPRRIQSNGPLCMSFHFVILGWWIRLESIESCGSRYGNIEILSISLALGPIPLLIIAKSLKGGLTGSGRSHLFDYMHRQPDLIPGRVTSGRETSSPPRSCASPMQSSQEVLPSGNSDTSSFIQSLPKSDDWQYGVCLAKPSWFLHGNAGTRSSCLNLLLIAALVVLVKPQFSFNVVDLIIYSLLDSHSPSILVNAKSSVSKSFSTISSL